MIIKYARGERPNRTAGGDDEMVVARREKHNRIRVEELGQPKCR